MMSKRFKSEFLRNVVTLMTGTAIAQAIPFLISPVLSRLYSPEDFAVLASFMSIAAVLGVVSTGRYELAIMLPRHDRDAREIIVLSLLITTSVSLASLLLIAVFKNGIVLFFDAPELDPWIFLIPVMVFSMGLYQTFNYWSTRNKTFGKNAVSRVSQSGALSVTQLLAGAFRLTPLGLILGQILGQLTAGIILSWKALRHFRDFSRDVTWTGIKKNGRDYRNFPRINTPHAFMDTLKDHGIVMVIIYFFTKTILGSFSFAFRILKAPVGLIGNALYQVFYQRASRAVEEGTNLRTMVLRIYRNLFLIGLPLFGMLFIFTPDIFAFVFGDDYRVSGEIAQIIIPWIFLNFIAAPASCLTVVMNRQKEAMLITIVDVVLRMVSLGIGGITGDYKLAFILMSVSCGSVMIFAIYWYYSIAGQGVRNAYK